MNIWDENHSIELERNASDKVENGRSDTTTDTEKPSCKREWTIINGRKKWIRRCEVCGCNCYNVNKTLCYSTRPICRSCSKKETTAARPWTAERRAGHAERLVGNSYNLGRKLSTEWKSNISNSQRGNTHRRGKATSPETIAKIKASLTGGKFSESHKNKIRESTVRYLKSCIKAGARYNKSACAFFDALNQALGWRGLHAENGGEKIVVGYFVDYYEPDLNIVIEYDEPHHYKNGKLRPKDQHRQQTIMDQMQCRFIRYNLRTKTLMEYHADTPPTVVNFTTLSL